MPTVIKQGGFRIKILGPPREHPPPHVHIYKGPEAAVVIRLGLEGGPPEVWEVYKMRGRDVVKAYRIVETHAEELQKAWEDIHG